MNVKSLTLPVRIEKEMYDRVKKAAADDDRTMSGWCKLAIKRELERFEIGRQIKVNHDKH